jgi:hypothetical protein
MFHQAESVTYHLSMEAKVPNLYKCSIHQGIAAMVGVEDLECIITKVSRFCIVWGRMRVSMKVYLVDGPHEALCPSHHQVWSL